MPPSDSGGPRRRKERVSHHLTADPGDHVTTAPDASAPATSPATPDLRFEELLPSAARLVLVRPALLLPYALALLASALLAAVVEVVRAWTSPAMLVDGALVYAGLPSTTVTATAAALGLVGFVLYGVAAGAVVLGTGAELLARRSSVVAALRELRRRWLLVLGYSLLWGLAVVAVVAVVFALLLFLGTVVGAVFAVGAALLVLQGVIRASRLCTAALLHGTRVRHARRELAVGDRFVEVREHRRRGENVVIGAVVTVVAAFWGLRWAAADVPAPWRDALVEGVQGIAGSALLTFAAVVLTWSHIRTAGLLERWGHEAKVWAGAARVAEASAGTAQAADTHRPRTARRLGVLGTVLVVWAATPAVLAAPAALDLTPALSPRTMRISGSLHEVLLTGTPDGIAVFSRFGERGDAITRCSVDDGACVVDDPRGLEPVAAVPDPDGSGLVIVQVRWGPTVEEQGYALVTCSPEDCSDPTARVTRTRVVVPASWGPQEHDVAVRGGVLVLARPTGGRADEGRGLLVCRTSLCDEPTALPLEFTPGVEPAVAVTSDGVAWVAHATDSEIHLSRAQVGSTALTDVLTLPLLRARESDGPTAFEMGVLDLALLKDDSPVVLHRASPDGALKVLTCDDPACGGTTSVTVPGGAAVDAALAVDGSGLPLVAAVRDAGVVLHACRDRACTSVRSGLMATRWPGYGIFGEAVPFFAVDGQDRPAVLVEERWDESLLVQCPEPRCGL